MKKLFFVLCGLLATKAMAQVSLGTERLNLQWAANGRTFPGAGFDGTIPAWCKTLPLPQYGDLAASLQNVVTAPVSELSPWEVALLTNEFSIQTFTGKARNELLGSVSVLTMRRNPSTGATERLVSADLVLNLRSAATPEPILSSRAPISSVLSSGSIYKIGIPKTGIYKLDRSFLTTLGVPASFDPRQVQLFGNVGGMLPEINNAARPIDLNEIPIVVNGEADGSFDANDNIVFYAQGPDAWSYDATAQMLLCSQNDYAAENYVFLKLGATTTPKRVIDNLPVAAGAYTTTTYDAYEHYEKNLYCLLADPVSSSPPSGREFYGELFRFNADESFPFSFPNAVTSETMKLRTAFAGRAIGTGSYNGIQVKVNNGQAQNMSFGYNSSATYSIYASTQSLSATYNISSDNFTVDIHYTQPNSDASAWLDYITLNMRSRLDLANHGGQFCFRDTRTLGEATVNYNLSGWQNATVWDVTDLGNIRKMNINGSGSFSQVAANTLHEFVMFDGSSFLTPTAVGAVANQDLHNTTPTNLLLIYHPDLEATALQYAQYRQNQSNITVTTVSTTQVYNEFSSGRADISAIRDLAKYWYDNDVTQQFKHILLFGDASYDYKGNVVPAAQNTNLVPTYESRESLNPIGSFCTDDYFGLLTDGEGNVNSGFLDIGVGRLPIRNNDEATIMMEKIRHYENDLVTNGDWKNRITFTADDGDGGLHLRDAEAVSNVTEGLDKVYNINKVYLDAYAQVSTSAGTRYPDAQQAMLNDLFRGTFVWTYAGHGGPNGLTQERVFTDTEIESLTNYDKLPLFITATCEFAPFDNPAMNTSGEELVRKSDGGAIAAMSTTRLVYAYANRQMNLATFDNIFGLVNGQHLTIGETIAKGKNEIIGSADVPNTRKFVLLGDPSMKLAFPELGVATDSINSRIPSLTDSTIMFRALSRMTIKGHLTNADGTRNTTYNGTVYPTVFDKKQNLVTRGNPGGNSTETYDLQKSTIFKGRAAVVNGNFEFTFVVPRDIDYNIGQGKISYYAENGTEVEAAGYTNDILVGSINNNAPTDNQPPLVQVFMNNDQFAFGGITNADPVLLAKLSDDNGINTTGASIGHDLTSKLTIESETQDRSYVLNDYYVSAINDFRRGELRYPLFSLPEGRHRVTVKAWDTYNNSGEGSTEFIVAPSASMALAHVLNYPNPFSTHTEFQFEHNYPNQPLDVMVQVFTVSGRLVKTINQTVTSDGTRVTGLAWDGQDDFGDKIGRGVYVYRITVRAQNGAGEAVQNSAYEKLVILR